MRRRELRESVCYLSCLVAILAAASCSTARSTSSGSRAVVNPAEQPPHIRHYLERCAAFEAENRERRSVILLGDSITEGFDVAKYFPGKPVLNRGISSDTIGIVDDDKDLRGVLKRLGNSVYDCRPSHVFLMIGVNDLGDKRTPDEMIVGYRHILQSIRAHDPSIVVHVESLLPTGGKFAFHNSNIVEFNRRLRDLAEEMGCPYLDLHSLMADTKGELRSDLTRDGLHINAEGYAIWKREIDAVMGWAE